jgi:putative acetyltransferase
MNIRRESPGDEARIRAIYETAFETTAEADVVEALRAESKPYVGLVAEEEGTIVGHLVLTEVVVETHAGRMTGLGLAPLGVDRQAQGKGVGSALVLAALQEARSHHSDFLVILGDPKFYTRFGFVQAAPALRWRSRDFDPYFMVYPLREGILDDLRGVVTYQPAIERM